MKNKSLNTILAEAIRIDYENSSGEVYIVFQVLDEDFKKHIKDNWIDDIDLKIIGRKLFKNTEDE
jgi:hypothetical protein